MLELNEYIIVPLGIIFIIISQFDIKHIMLIITIIFITIYIYKDSYKEDIRNGKNKENENIDKLEKYKQNIEYKYGVKYWSLFNKKLESLKDTDNYDSAELLLETCMKHLRSLSMKNNDIELINNLDKLYKEGLLKLKEKANILNNEWTNNPNNTLRQIVINAPKPHNMSFI